MASTNKTTNYELSQFIATDKPAWLGDYNQDMSKIDAGMKDNADDITTLGTTVSGHTSAISGLTTDLGTAQGDITALAGRVTTIEGEQTTQNTAITNAQNTADTANGKADTNATNIASQGLDITSLQTDVSTNTTAISSLNTELDALETATSNNFKSFDMKNVTNETNTQFISNYSGIESFWADGGTRLYLAQSDDSKCFKLYGALDLYRHTNSSTTLSKQAVQGLSGVYGFKTTLHLTTPPTEGYVIYGCGQLSQWDGANEKIKFLSTTDIAVGTDGYIYLHAGTGNTQTIGANTMNYYQFHPSILFNESLGDIPTPE